jgi:hypothetical protein
MTTHRVNFTEAERAQLRATAERARADGDHAYADVLEQLAADGPTECASWAEVRERQWARLL